MDLGTVKARVRRALGKGSSVDTDIVDALRTSARTIEQQRSWQYMKRFGTTALDLTADFPYMIDAPEDFKAITLVRLVESDGSFTRIPRSDNFRELLWEARPTGYDLDATLHLVFNCTPTEALEFQIFWDAYSSWPTVDTGTNWLLKNGEQVLFAEAMLQMAPALRDPRMVQMFQQQRDEGFRSLLMADEEMQDSNQDLRMNFNPEGGFDWPLSS